MKSTHYEEWIRLCYHCPLDLVTYLEMPRWDRFELHAKLSEFIEKANEEIDGGSSTSGPRQARREGAF